MAEVSILYPSTLVCFVALKLQRHNAMGVALVSEIGSSTAFMLPPLLSKLHSSGWLSKVSCYILPQGLTPRAGEQVIVGVLSITSI